MHHDSHISLTKASLCLKVKLHEDDDEEGLFCSVVYGGGGGTGGCK